MLLQVSIHTEPMNTTIMMNKKVWCNNALVVVGNKLNQPVFNSAQPALITQL